MENSLNYYKSYLTQLPFSSAFYTSYLSFLAFYILSTVLYKPFTFRYCTYFVLVIQGANVQVFSRSFCSLASACMRFSDYFSTRFYACSYSYLSRSGSPFDLLRGFGGSVIFRDERGDVHFGDRGEVIPSRGEYLIFQHNF